MRQGNLDMVRTLVARGANLDARTGRGDDWAAAARRSSGLTPFLTAAQAGNVEMLRALLGLGADPAARSDEGAGGVLLATRGRNLEAVELMIELGLDVNVHPAGRPSALHTAIRAGEDAIVEYLAAHDADFDALDHHGRTPLEEAEFEAPTPTIELMRRLTAERTGGGAP